MLFAYIDPGTGFVIPGIAGLTLAFLFAFLGIVSVFFKRIYRFIKKNKKYALLLLLIIVLGIIIGKNMRQNTPKIDKKIIILGFDGMSPEIVDEMMRDGQLPNLSLLKEKGSYARLATTTPAESPVAWSGFSTGKNPGKNGIYEFIIRDPNDYSLSISFSQFKNGRPLRALKTKAFWQYLSEKHIPSVILNCPVTFPPDKIEGKMLSGMGVTDILGTEGTFSYYTTEPKNYGEETGGKVFHVAKSPTIILDLIGPRVAMLGKKGKNTKVPFKVSFIDKENISIEYQNKKIVLKAGSWSDWCSVIFDLGLFRRAKGIFKFYCCEVRPDLKLYATPINFDPRDPLFDISYPREYSKELADKIGLYRTLGIPVETWSINQKRIYEEQLLEKLNEVFLEKLKMLRLELSEFKRGLLFSYFVHTDTIQHMFWRYTNPENPLYEENPPEKYKNMIKEWYKKMDEVTGEILANIDDKTTLIILSDHGFNTYNRAVDINAWLMKNGYLKLNNPLAVAGSELFADIDWSQTKAYSAGFGSIYVNQKGREINGIVEPGDETQRLKTEIADKLKKWIDEESAKPVVSAVYTNEDTYKGAYSKKAPDIYIGFNIGYRASWRSAIGGVGEKIIKDNEKKWSGTHLIDPKLVPGILFSNRKIEKKDPSILDIAPTILKTFGFSEDDIEKCDFDGKPLF